MTSLPRPAVTPARPWTFPEPTRTALDNGLTVLAYHLPGQHVVSVRVAVPLPLSREPYLAEGVATIMARTLDEGTQRYDSQAFAQLMERRGVRIEAGVAEAGLTVALDAASPNLAYGLDLLRQAITEPAFPDSEVTREVRRRLADIEQERANPGSRAALEFIATHWDRTQRASRPGAGRKESVAAITAPDVRRFHELEVGPQGGTVVVAGDLTGIDAAGQIEHALGGWGGGRTPAPDLRGVEPTRAPDAYRIVLVDRPGSVQTELTVGGRGPDRMVSGGWAPYPAAAFAMGGAPTARIDAVLREDKGYTYGIRSAFRPRRRGGLFVTSGSVRADATVDSLDLLLGLLDAGRDGFTDTEAAAASDFLVMTAPGRFVTADVVADEAASLSLEGLTTDFTTAMLRDLAGLDGQRLTEAYRRYVTGEWTVVVVGDAEVHLAGIEALGRGPVTVVPV